MKQAAASAVVPLLWGCGALSQRQRHRRPLSAPQNGKRWVSVSEQGKALVQALLTVDADKRPTGPR